MTVSAAFDPRRTSSFNERRGAVAPLNEQRPDFTIAVLDQRTDTNANAKAAVTPITGL
jgi:hypothetical protein